MKKNSISDRQAMELAIAQAIKGIRKGQSPFGCVLVRNGRLLARSHNTVWQDGDPTAHAEVNAIRQACRCLGTIDLSGTVLYATCEPCPMCLSAAHWARITRIVFGASIRDAARAGFNELNLPVSRLQKASRSITRVRAGFMAERCRSLFKLWQQAGKGKPY